MFTLASARALRDFGQNTGLIRGFDREHIGLKREHASFAREHERLGGIAHDHAHNSVTDSIKRGQRVKLIPALASTSHTRASAPGRLARKTASWVPVSTESLGSAFMLLETDAWKPF